MGYRSDVAYKIKFEKGDDFWGFIAEAKLDPETALCFNEDEWGTDFEVDEKHYEIRLLCESVKWYDSYTEVQAQTALWEKAEARCEEEDIEVSGAFCRIGEDGDDNEEKYFGDDPYDFVRISRQVIVDWA
jgi:hypothetical protein